MSDDSKHICSAERAGSLDSRIRRWLQNPTKILAPYVKEGMTVLDFGCGPGYFTIDMARMVGERGRVIACDLQQGMLDMVSDKAANGVSGSDLEDRITLHKCEEDKIGISDRVDFVLLFYVVHEVPDQKSLFSEIATILKPTGQVLIVEPPFHVSKAAFAEMIGVAREVGFRSSEGVRVLLSKSVVLNEDRRKHGRDGE